MWKRCDAVSVLLSRRHADLISTVPAGKLTRLVEPFGGSARFRATYTAVLAVGRGEPVPEPHHLLPAMYVYIVRFAFAKKRMSCGCELYGEGCTVGALPAYIAASVI